MTHRAITPEEKARSCRPDEIDGFIQAARDRGDKETERAGIAEKLRMEKGKR